ncbi:hypothetical protein AB5N19_08989 [Seiridium cardinale]|uniref:Uncharacterized protein n=1 Tax=Seiridium cardinale TaxID=138064 RepID=A0ABR2Y705_9PEZI
MSTNGRIDGPYAEFEPYMAEGTSIKPWEDRDGHVAKGTSFKDASRIWPVVSITANGSPSPYVMNPDEFKRRFRGPID